MSKRNKYKYMNKKIFRKIDKFWQFGKPIGDFMDENPWTWLVVLLLVGAFVAYRMDFLLYYRRRRVTDARADYFEARPSTSSSTTTDPTSNKKTQ